MLKLHFDPFPELTGNRLRLRALVPEDAPRIAMLRSDPAVNIHLNRPEKMTVYEAEAFIRKISNSVKNNESMYWVMELKEKPGLIGTLCFWSLEPELDQGEIGYELMPAFQGKGLMQEAVELAIGYGFREMGMRKIMAILTRDNDKSIKVLERNHFLRDDNVHIEPEPGGPPLVFYSLTQDN